MISKFTYALIALSILGVSFSSRSNKQYVPKQQFVPRKPSSLQERVGMANSRHYRDAFGKGVDATFDDMNKHVVLDYTRQQDERSRQAYQQARKRFGF